MWRSLRFSTLAPSGGHILNLVNISTAEKRPLFVSILEAFASMSMSPLSRHRSDTSCQLSTLKAFEREKQQVEGDVTPLQSELFSFARCF